MIEFAHGGPVVAVEEGYRDHQISVPQPAVGHDFTYTCPFDCSVRNVMGMLTTSAVAGNRTVILRYTTPQGVIFVNIAMNANQTASNTWNNNWFIGATLLSLGTQELQPLPEMWIPRGTVISSKTQAMDAGDQWAGITIVTRLHHKSVSL